MSRSMPRSGGAARHTLSRREVLRAGSLAMLGLAGPLDAGWDAAKPATLILPQAGRGNDARRCIFLFLVGGPSQLDTFDPKPEAPAEVRGPFGAIRTNVPGIQLSELLARTARHADQFAVLRSLHHTAAGVHETGQQLMQTGRLAEGGPAYPHVGCVCGFLRGSRHGLPAHVVVPGPIGNTGCDLPHGQGAGLLSPEHDPLTCSPAVFTTETQRRGEQQTTNDKQQTNRMDGPRWRAASDLSAEPERIRDAYGPTLFGRSCLLARRLVEHGARVVTVNMFPTARGATWDAHGSPPFSGLEAYATSVVPTFDQAYSALLPDLHGRGLLADTLVVATGEFGRTPRINAGGGRDHWPHCWSMLLAGGGIRGGQIIGASDEIGAYPKDRPITPAEVVATIYHHLGIDPATTLPGPQGLAVPLVNPGVEPIRELF